MFLLFASFSFSWFIRQHGTHDLWATTKWWKKKEEWITFTNDTLNQLPFGGQLVYLCRLVSSRLSKIITVVKTGGFERYKKQWKNIRKSDTSMGRYLRFNSCQFFIQKSHAQSTKHYKISKYQKHKRTVFLSI